MKKIFLIITASILLAIPMIAQASSDFGKNNLTKAVGSSYSKNKDLSTSISNIISAVLALAGTIFLVLTVYGGITWMTAMGNSDKIDKAREIIVAAVIGVSISAGAYGITYFVFSRLGEANSVNNSENVGCCIYALPGESKQSKSTMTKGECDNVNGNWDANSSGCY